MNIIDVKREIAFSKLLGIKLPNDIKELLDFFKELTYRQEKDDDDLETWYDSNGEITIQFNEKDWHYIIISHKKWNFLYTKYPLNTLEICDLISGILELITNGRIFPINIRILPLR